MILLPPFIAACAAPGPVAPTLPPPTATPTASATLRPFPSPQVTRSTPRPSETSIPRRTDQPLETPTPNLELPDSPPANPERGDAWRSAVDGMVLSFVPGGAFYMGSGSESTVAEPDERPQRRLELESFWIDTTEVTNSMYARCVASGACAPPAASGSATREQYFGDPAFANYPVIYVTQAQAQAYCTWAGRRLPSEAEGEKAARGPDARPYPWGWIGAPESGGLVRLSFCDAQCPYEYRMESVDDGYADTAAVGSFASGASPFGALDMAGNVWEWVAQVYGPAAYRTEATPTPSPGILPYVIRGGSWLDPFLRDEVPAARAANRAWRPANHAGPDLGFRCVYPP